MPGSENLCQFYLHFTANSEKYFYTYPMTIISQVNPPTSSPFTSPASPSISGQTRLNPVQPGNGRFSQLLSLTLASSASSSNPAGIDSGGGSLLTPILFMLLEQLLARSAEEEQTEPETPLMASMRSGEAWQDPNDAEVGGGKMPIRGANAGGSGAKINAMFNSINFQHINQFDAERQVGGDGRNANCGPASLVMALHALGLQVRGAASDTPLGKLVDLARVSMSPGAARDGVDANGNRIESEHSTYTNFLDLARGAAAAGAKAARILPNASAIQRALQSGSAVIASGTFSGKSPLPWTGDRGIDNQTAPGGAASHIIAITAYLPDKNLFVVHDPARRSEIHVSADALERFMRGNAGALAVSA